MAKNRAKEKPPTSIAQRIAAWDEAMTIAKFFKNKMGQDGNADRIANNIIQKSLTEEKPEWTRLLLDSMKSDEKASLPGGTNINFFQVASEQINEAAQALIDVTPNKKVKKGIEGII